MRLNESVRGALAPLYGSEFTDVRIHHDATSQAATREVNARAFTLGPHIHFAAGEYRPEEHEGLRLLAHELAHTVQQRGAGESVDGGIEIGAADSSLEREADAAADAALADRAVRVGSGRARGVQAKLLQREEAVPGGDTATLDQKIDENTVTHITRTIKEGECKSKKITQATPSDKIFKWDSKANALSMHYDICNGRIKLKTDAEINYDKVVESAKNLLTTLQNNPALGNDLGSLLNDRLEAATISGTGEIKLVVDGILQAGVESSSTAGTGAQQLKVQGVLKITPKGMSFAVTGGIDFSQTPLKKDTTYTLQGKFATTDFAVTLRYDQIDTSPATGPSTSKREVSGGLQVPLPGDSSLSGTLKVDPDNPRNVTPGLSFEKKFGGPDTTEKVGCFRCECVPPQPQYTCTREVKAHKLTITDKPSEARTVKLLYNYNSATPANKDDFDRGVAAIATMVKDGFVVDHIWGYASPEGSLDTPKPPVPGFKGNIELSERRATKAHDSIAEKAAGAALPKAEGKGELLGDLGSGDTSDKDLTPKLVALLEPLSDEQRLDTLGVSDEVRADANQKAKAIAEINAFVAGKEANKLALAKRPRWEKIFPFLRRVEIAVHHEAVMHEKPVEGSSTTGCYADDIAYAKANMPPLPPARRVPPKEGPCGGGR